MSENLPRELVVPGAYDAPQTRARNRFRDTLRQLKKKVERQERDGADLVPENLERSTAPVFSDEVWSALEDRVFSMLDGAYGTWIGDTESEHRVCACLTHPSAPRDIFERWARARGHRVLTDGKPDDRLAFAVLPAFDQIIERSLDGLQKLREFCEKIEAANTQLLLCGTSVQWAFLRRVSALDLIVSDVRIVPPFDGQALRALIRTDGKERRLRSRESGQDIQEMSGENLECEYLADLAAEVRGCPWAALQVMERSVTRDPDDDESATWVGRPDWPVLPAAYEREAHFMLHALMVHGSLSRAALAERLPMRWPIGLARTLERTGFLDRDDAGLIAIKPYIATYTRRLLSDAGFPVDEV